MSIPSIKTLVLFGFAIFCAGSGAAQQIFTYYPTADISVSSWVTDTGSTSILYASVDNPPGTSSDYIINNNVTDADVVFRLGPTVYPFGMKQYVATLRVEYSVECISKAVGTNYLSIFLKNSAGSVLATSTVNPVCPSVANHTTSVISPTTLYAGDIPLTGTVRFTGGVSVTIRVHSVELELNATMNRLVID